MFQRAQSFGGLRRTASKPNKVRPLSILRLWGLPNFERPQSFRGSRFKKIEASQHFETLGASKPREASIFFGIYLQKCWKAPKDCNDSRLKKIEASQHFGTLGAAEHGEARILLRFQTQKKLRPVNALGCWELPNLERPQCFWGLNAKTLGGPKRF